MSVTTQQKSKTRDATRREGKEGNGAVFREGYYAQLRDVLGANMRAVEAVDEEEPMGGRRHRAINEDTVNSLMEDVRREIAAEGELVTKEKVRRPAAQFASCCIDLTFV